MKLYHYNQNNSGGIFIGPALNVYVEADSSVEANSIAEDNGLYFNGVEEGHDCECCGDRWGGSWGDPEYSVDELKQELQNMITGNHSDYDEHWMRESRGRYNKFLLVLKSGITFRTDSNQDFLDYLNSL